MESLSKVAFHFKVGATLLRNRQVLKRFIISIFKKEGKRLRRITYIFCSDGDLLQINKQFLQHDFYTDIITFDLSEDEAIIGEVYISIDRVRDNYKTFGSTFKEELHRVVFHGALHLCGYKDKRKSEIQIMRNKEQQYLDTYFK